VTRVYNNHEAIGKSGDKKLEQLNSLAKSLQGKRENATSQAEVAMIDEALLKVADAREDHIKNNPSFQANAFRPAIESDTATTLVSDLEQNQIAKIHAHQGLQILPGQKFASLNGKEPANYTFMKSNINSLFSLIDSKEEATV
jgi:hypothetical protein